MIAGECKFENQKTSIKVLNNLLEKVKEVKWKVDDREERYFIFSKKGFKGNLIKEISQKDQIYLITIDEL